ncbi:sugar transferase [Candidatus Pelagibacter communis]|uniref:sugar transferase n=1 Tax=Pelagibacter ubique TaxID=198252 RepID=UPI00094C15AF|nr:sugar transferase [Candidatus Pelagibacter ubique]
MYFFFKRIFDIFFSVLIVIPIIIILIILYIFIKIESKGPFIHWSRRVGIDNKIFYMPKIRTMIVGSPDVATHLLKDPDKFVTKIGHILRKKSLDELPQIYSVLKGDMSLVGPRPALHNQGDLISERKKYEIDAIKPGITGWAQINGRDNLTIIEKVQLDKYYYINKSVLLDLLILFKTLVKSFNNKYDISH